MRKRILTLALALMMVLSLVPATFAAETETEAYWPNFRNSLYNMAITDAETPTSAATTVEKWVGSYGSGWSNSPSALIIADDALIFMNMSSLKKVDLQTGDVLAEGTMSASGGFVIISPTYADGLIFCPLSGGKIEAFDVKTLESVWLFSDTLGGQNNTPITYSDGYLYTGYWNGEAKEANYVCVNASTGELVWSKAVAGGFYWAGSTVVGDAVIFGSDDGSSGFDGDSHLFALNRLTGEVISDITLTGMGDQRSTIAYSEEKGRVYFTTKNGYIVSAAVDAESGALSDLKSNKVSAQATSTPVVYGDKVYFGAGSGMREGSTAGNFFVVDANSLEYLYEVPLLGYPQGSIMISTAYLEETGKLYCYTTYNNNPGGLTLIKIDPTKNTADGAELEEIYDAAGHSQYCLISPICGPDGTIYYRNDSGYIFALTNNNAYLTGLTADVGQQNGTFSASDAAIEWLVPIGTESVTLNPTPCDGGTATVEGGNTLTLVDGTASATITVTKGEEARTYTVSIREISNDTSLSVLKVNEANSYSSAALTLTPELTSGTYYYGVYNVGSSRSFDNVWPVAADSNATVKVYALENVKAGKYDEETGEITITATNSGHNRYAIYFADDTKPMAIRIEVTAENGDIANYYLVLSKADAAEAGAALLETLKNCDHSDCTVTGAKDATCTEDGYTGDKICNACGYTIKGQVIDALGHDYEDGICTVCGETDPDYKTAEGDVEIFVTIADKGAVVVFQQPVTVVDVNHNGIFDVDDALFAAHEKFYTGGATAGYASYESQWGLSISMLWGDTSYCYGYWLNNASCWSLEDVVAEGNHLVAFVYQDSMYWSDAYSKFDSFAYSVEEDTALTVKLDKAGYDENWNTVFAAHSGATVTVYDADMKVVDAAVTDNGDGTYTVTLNAAGSYYLVATDSDPITVPAVCAVTVTAKAEVPADPDDTTSGSDSTDPDDTTSGGDSTDPSNPGTSTEPPRTGDETNIIMLGSLMVISMLALAALLAADQKRRSCK